MEPVLLTASLPFDVPDDPVIHEVTSGNTPLLIGGVILIAAVLIYVFFIRKKAA